MAAAGASAAPTVSADVRLALVDHLEPEYDAIDKRLASSAIGPKGDGLWDCWWPMGAAQL